MINTHRATSSQSVSAASIECNFKSIRVMILIFADGYGTLYYMSLKYENGCLFEEDYLRKEFLIWD